MSASQLAKCQTFHTLHDGPGIFVMPNPWDAGTALYLQAQGFKALASTSAGAAFALGRPDGGMRLDEVLAHLDLLVRATDVPINAYFEDGLASDLDEMFGNVSRCVASGVAGLSIEDRCGRSLHPFEVAVERVAAARRAIDASGMPVLLTARSEAVLLGASDALEEARRRLVAFRGAGADCLFAPGVRDPASIATLVEAVAPNPLNVLMSTPGLSLAELRGLGVRRVSVGSALARASWGAFIAATQEIVGAGTFEAFGSAAPMSTLDSFFRSAGRSGSDAGP